MSLTKYKLVLQKRFYFLQQSVWTVLHLMQFVAVFLGSSLINKLVHVTLAYLIMVASGYDLVFSPALSQLIVPFPLYKNSFLCYSCILVGVHLDYTGV